MTVYLLDFLTFFNTHIEYTVIGIYDNIEKLKEQYLKSAFELNKIDDSLYIEKKVIEWEKMSNNSSVEYGFHPHPLSITKYFLNNDPISLYEPGGEIYDICKEKIHLISQN